MARATPAKKKAKTKVGAWFKRQRARRRARKKVDVHAREWRVPVAVGGSVKAVATRVKRTKRK